MSVRYLNFIRSQLFCVVISDNADPLSLNNIFGVLYLCRCLIKKMDRGDNYNVDTMFTTSFEFSMVMEEPF